MTIVYGMWWRFFPLFGFCQRTRGYENNIGMAALALNSHCKFLFGSKYISMFYCHGFVSCFDSGNPKIEQLKELGPVAGCNIDYTKTANEVVTEVMKLVEEPCERPDDFDLDLYIRSGAMGDS